MERLKSLVISTPLDSPFEWLRMAAKLPSRLRHPELKEIYLEPGRFKKVLAKMLKSDSNVIDVGAHLGGILSSVLKLAPHGRHFAFEPIPRKANWLRAKFPGVEVSEVAVSDFSGQTTFFEDSKQTALSGLRIGSVRTTSTIEIPVSCRPLDDCVPEEYLPDVLKVDVLGAELQVLRGARRIIERSHPFILFATGTRKLSAFGTKPVDLYDWISDQGYSVFFLADFLSGGPPSDCDRFLAAHEYPFQAFNFAAQFAGTVSDEPEQK